ncbi:MAG: hypothetical protein A2220_09335 [Ignavibacteria bacterium RIFOXYA2_FULL_35_10]|nr:MAG: hypothetical protein A2220_09335 [Ignavibacteria bacterium RIFOXYA2_FULL_35_10]
MLIKLKYIVIILMLVIAVDMAAQGSVHDNTSQSSRTGNGAFTATTLIPITITVVPRMPQGESFTMVENQTVYFTNEHYHFTYTIWGADDHSIAFETSLTPTDGPVVLTPIWYAGPDANEESWEIYTSSYNEVDLNSSGRYYVRCELESATAEDGTGGNTYTFTATVTAWYIDSL